MGGRGSGRTRRSTPALSQQMIETASTIMLTGGLTHERIERTGSDGRARRYYAWCDGTREPVDPKNTSISALIRHGIARFDFSTGTRRIVIGPAGYDRFQKLLAQSRQTGEAK